MVLGADSGRDQPSVVLRLMYLDHSQFAELKPDDEEGEAAAPQDQDQLS